MTLEISEIITELEDTPEARAMTRPELEALAGQIARLRDAQARIDKDGLIVQDGKSNPIEHPAIAIELKAQDEIRKWGQAQRRM